MRMLLDNWRELRRAYTFGAWTFYNTKHIGLDVVVPVGTPIYAHTDGFVQKFIGSAGGRTIHMKDENGMLVRCLHLSKFAKLGNVKKGDVIGYTGGDPSDPYSGITTGPHVHIDVSKNSLQLNNMNNFIDPELYFQAEPLKVKLLCVGDVDRVKYESYARSVFNWFAEKSNYELKFQYEIEYLDELEPINWVERKYKFFSYYWAGKYLSARASGFDIVVTCLPDELWEAKKLLGFALVPKLLGVQVIGMKLDLNRKHYRKKEMENDIQFTATLRHEIIHALYAMQGSKYNGTDEHSKGKDNTHYYDYVAHDMVAALGEINRDKVKGWKLKNLTRIFAYGPFRPRKTQKPDWEPKNGKIYYSQDNRMFFIYEKGWRIIDEEKFLQYRSDGRKVGMMSITEANWVYKQLGEDTPEIDNGHIVQKIVTSKLAKWYRLYGFKKDIPTNHLT